MTKHDLDKLINPQGAPWLDYVQTAADIAEVDFEDAHRVIKAWLAEAEIDEDPQEEFVRALTDAVMRPFRNLQQSIVNDVLEVVNRKEGNNGPHQKG